MTFVPVLTPGREDYQGCMQVPHDIFVHVSTTPGWSENISTHEPSTRRVYLESIKYWMDGNGACIIRSGSTSKFALIQDINQCATKFYGNPIIITPDGPMQPGEGANDGGGGGPPPPPPQQFQISVNPEAGGYPLTVTLTIERGNEALIDTFFIDWDDGTTTSNVSGMDPIVHEYPIVGEYALSVQPRKANGDNYSNPKSQLITVRTEQ